MKKIFFITIVGLVFVLSSCVSSNNTVAIGQDKTTIPTGYYALDISFVNSRKITDSQLINLQTYISEEVIISEKVTPETRSEKNFFEIEDGDAVDIKQFRINQKKKQAGYRGGIEKMDEIQFIKRVGNIYTFETEAGIQMHFSPNYTGTFLLQKVDNFVGVYSTSKFYRTKIVFRYRKKIEQIFD